MSNRYVWGILDKKDGSLILKMVASSVKVNPWNIITDLAGFMPSQGGVKSTYRMFKEADLYSGDIANIQPEEFFRAKNIREVHSYASEIWENTKCVFVFVPKGKKDGVWTFINMRDPESFNFYVHDPVKAGSSKFTLVEADEKWVDANFFRPLAPKKAVAKPRIRLSKEDWLKANYPGMTELPKWRFPSVAG
jgi:hypothetical protein